MNEIKALLTTMSYALIAFILYVSVCIVGGILFSPKNFFPLISLIILLILSIGFLMSSLKLLFLGKVKLSKKISDFDSNLLNLIIMFSGSSFGYFLNLIFVPYFFIYQNAFQNSIFDGVFVDLIFLSFDLDTFYIIVLTIIKCICFLWLFIIPSRLFNKFCFNVNHKIFSTSIDNILFNYPFILHLLNFTVGLFIYYFGNCCSGPIRHIFTIVYVVYIYYVIQFSRKTYKTRPIANTIFKSNGNTVSVERKKTSSFFDNLPDTIYQIKLSKELTQIPRFSTSWDTYDSMTDTCFIIGIVFWHFLKNFRDLKNEKYMNLFNTNTILTLYVDTKRTSFIESIYSRGMLELKDNGTDEIILKSEFYTTSKRAFIDELDSENEVINNDIRF